MRKTRLLLVTSLVLGLGVLLTTGLGLSRAAPSKCATRAPDDGGPAAQVESIILGMGCFWGAEGRMAELPGVIDVESGKQYRHLIVKHQELSNLTPACRTSRVHLFSTLQPENLEISEKFLCVHPTHRQTYQQSDVPRHPHSAME